MTGQRACDYAPGVGWLLGTLLGLAIDPSGYVGGLVLAAGMVAGTLVALRWGTR